MSTATATSKGPVFDPGLCRCCGTMRKCRLLNTEYENSGAKEVYSDMIMDCFGLLLSYLDGKPTERLICAICVHRLRDALAFRKQVLQCEEAFLQVRMSDTKAEEKDSQTAHIVSQDGARIEIEIVKTEPHSPSPQSPPSTPEDNAEDPMDSMDTSDPADSIRPDTVRASEPSSAPHPRLTRPRRELATPRASVKRKPCELNITGDPADSIRPDTVGASEPSSAPHPRLTRPRRELATPRASVKRKPCELNITGDPADSIRPDTVRASEPSSAPHPRLTRPRRELATPRASVKRKPCELNITGDPADSIRPDTVGASEPSSAPHPRLTRPRRELATPRASVKRKPCELNITGDPADSIRPDTVGASEPSSAPHPRLTRPRRELATTRASVKRKPLPMSKMQQIIRERDTSYMLLTNVLSIVEFSYVCPFKCRHNNLLCYYCGDSFTDPQQIRNHTEEIHHPKKFKVSERKNVIKVDISKIDCRLCPQKITTLEDFKKHISTVHKKQYYFDHKDSILPFRLKLDEWKCALCDQEFAYFHALNKHMNEHFSNYVCETCGLGFVDIGRFMMHQQRHEEADYPCPECGKNFKAHYNRELHIDRVHKKRGRVYCPKCDTMLMSYHQKLKHLVQVHGEAPLSFPCSLCDKVLDSRRSLTIHKRKDHYKDYRFECQICGQKFFTNFALNNHMPTHTGERNFKCKVCDKSYPRMKTLREHSRIHTNDRRYRCHVCGQAFIQNCSLKGHMKSQHPEYG